MVAMPDLNQQHRSEQFRALPIELIAHHAPPAEPVVSKHADPKRGRVDGRRRVAKDAEGFEPSRRATRARAARRGRPMGPSCVCGCQRAAGLRPRTGHGAACAHRSRHGSIHRTKSPIATRSVGRRRNHNTHDAAALVREPAAGTPAACQGEASARGIRCRRRAFSQTLLAASRYLRPHGRSVGSSGPARIARPPWASPHCLRWRRSTSWEQSFPHESPSVKRHREKLRT